PSSSTPACSCATLTSRTSRTTSSTRPIDGLATSWVADGRPDLRLHCWWCCRLHPDVRLPAHARRRWLRPGQLVMCLGCLASWPYPCFYYCFTWLGSERSPERLHQAVAR